MPNVADVMVRSELPAPVYRGKVRDTYDLGDRLLIVATDRISALDVVLPTPIPGKGRVLTMLSAWWFERIGAVVPNHYIGVVTESNRAELPFEVGPEYWGRSMVVRKAKRLDAECIARGYLSGSAWKEYRETGMVCGIRLPEGLRESDRLPEPIFTPSTKAAEGHDRNISYAELAALVGEEAANAMRIRTLAVYGYAHAVALERGIVIADTKFEFGWWNEEVILIDEVLTPDSSRFWLASEYRPGGPQPSLDKQPVRDWLAANWREGDPVPELPPEVVAATTDRYFQAYRMLTGEELSL
ncbi:phosphoribosylaminoimidazolesuccinocarboxamide synthase [Tepidiforma sp.]|uniref:phosphoribosylaminoimidazolesuccinocarboxamide synthase n=1 Tax=Tepidiforma sp. TaxID=2682230 RepID=UPI002ADE0930|nr:phosphoribosylaminoimidazolesuccinocarboxamide synthase [Tepidiforma sp.]